ncbi:histidine kinase [Shewanella sp. OPT22]|nr:histidine kinase [Shewanella sp. OPT22]
MAALRLRYQTLEFNNTDIHLCTLRDRNQFHDPDGEADKLGISSASWPLFGIVWPSSIVLADFMQNYEIKNKRILEIGCGIGLTSLLLNKRKADITASDYHPAVSEFLDRNIKLNGLSSIKYYRADWTDNDHEFGKFDVIIGSDVLYDEFSIEALAQFINKHTEVNSEVILVDPRRGHKGKLIKHMHNHGFDCTSENFHSNDSSFEPVRGHLLKFKR